MYEIEIKKDNFEIAIKEIEKLTKENDLNCKLERIKEKDWIFQHNATGAEINNLTINIQNNLNNIIEKINKNDIELKEIYKALVSLDKEYVSGLVEAINKANEGIARAEEAQDDIKKTIEIQALTIQKLKEINNELTNKIDINNNSIKSLEERIIKVEKVKKKTINEKLFYWISFGVICVLFTELILLMIFK